MKSGWIKLHRKLVDNPVVMKDSDYLALWVYLLLQASHAPCPIIFKGEKITLKPGQLITGRKVLSSELKIDENKVTRILKTFENEQQIEQQTSNKNRLITIVSWDVYQKGEQRNNQQVNNKRTTDEQQVNTNKNNKNIKDNREGKSGKSEKRFSPPSIEEVDSYIREKGYTVDAERFVNFYESKGWYVGKNKMKNWRAAVATWQKEDNKRNGINQQRSCDKRRGTEATATRPEDYEGKF